MADEWPILSLREAGVELIDCVHKTPPASVDGYPYVAIPQLKQGRLDLTNVRLISKEHFVEWTRKAFPKAYDVILSRRCNPGETAVVPPELRCALGQNLVLLRANQKTLHPPFLRWLVRGPEWWGQVDKFINVGAVFDSLRCADIPNFMISIPPFSVQKSIAHILGSLDDKIEVNRRMNETLEAMARALFKSWFIDFDPVRAKADGRKPEGMDEATAKLFPDSFEQSELGAIPRGWRVGTFGEAAVNSRRGVQPRDIEPSTPYVGLEHIPRRSIALSDWGQASSVNSNKSAFAKGEVLFGKLRPYFHKVVVTPVSGVCSTDILVLAPKEPAWLGFIVGHASSVELVNYADLCSTGTKMPRTNWGDISRFELVLPNERVAEKFTSLVQPFIQRITINIHENQSLAATRDALLPKLLSGEIRVKDAERFAEVAL